MSNHRPHFPLGTLTFNAEIIIAAATKHPEIAPRLPASYLTDTAAVLAKIPADVSGQKVAKGTAGSHTQAQRAKVDQLLHAMNQARKTARLAFPGETVKLHEEFQVGVQEHHDLGSVLGRADIILASLQTEANLPALKARGWTEADTTAFTALRATFPQSIETKQKAKSGGKTATTVKDATTADLYERLLTIQNAADLQWPATVPANAGVRDEFCLSTFPPGSAPAAPAAPPAPPSPPTPTPPAQLP